MRTIKFKSTPENWIKEYLGLKRNTVRKFDMDNDKDDIRFEVLQQYVFDTPLMLNIEIENTVTKDVFSRQVTDVTLWEGLFIISW